MFDLSGDLVKKYPDGVKFRIEGFSEFSPYAKAKVEIKGLSGNHYYDFKMPNEALSLKNTAAVVSIVSREQSLAKHTCHQRMIRRREDDIR